MCLNVIIQEKRVVLLLIPDNISVEEDLINTMNVSVKKYDESKFENYVHRECSNVVNRFFSNNRNINKNLHYILDDDNDDDEDDDDINNYKSLNDFIIIIH